MNEIYKYSLDVCLGDNRILMPRGAEILTAQAQHGLITLWARVFPEAPKEYRSIYVIYTGQPFPYVERRYIATVQLFGYVYHVFE